MKYKDAMHGLHFLAPPAEAEGGIPVEIVSYTNTSNGASCIDYELQSLTFTIKTSDIVSCKEMLLALGCEDKNERTVGFQGSNVQTLSLLKCKVVPSLFFLLKAKAVKY